MAFISLDSVDSTNEWTKKNLDSLSPHDITLVVSKTQTKGKGSYGKTWQSPPGNIYATFFFLLNKEGHIAHLTQVMAHSLIKVLQNFGIEGEMKWPNDVLVHGKKIAGILCETIPHDGKIAIVLGIGINVNMEDVQGIDQPTTSFFLEKKKKYDLNEILIKLRLYFIHDLSRYQQTGWKV